MLTTRDQVFISYSHQDAEWLEKLQKMLNPMVRNKTIKVWADTQIGVGKIWRDEIAQAIAKAKVAVLLVSPDFLASDFITQHELPPLLDAAKQEGLIVLWIPVRDSLYEETEIEQYQAAHNPKHPLAALGPPEQDTALKNIAQQIKAALLPPPSPQLSCELIATPEQSQPLFCTRDFRAQLGHETNPGLLSPAERLERITPGHNPYVTGSSLDGNSPVFFGRAQILHEILGTLKRLEKPGSVSIVGERRIGKSSLLNQVYQTLSREPGLITIHASAQNWNHESQQHFYENLSQAIASASGMTMQGDTRDYADFRDFVYALAQMHDFRFVLMLDEFEVMAGNPNFGADFFSNLRALGERPEYRFGYLTASRRPLRALCRDHSIDASSFWNIFGSRRVLGLLSEKEARALVAEPMTRSLPSEKCPETTHLWQETVVPLAGRHPALIQIVASAYWNAIDGGYDPDPLSIETDIRDHLEDLWYRRSKEELALLIRAADGKAALSGYTFNDLRQRGLLTHNGKPFCESFANLIAESLPEGKSLSDAVEALDQGVQRANQLLDRMEQLARSAGKIYGAFKNPNSHAEEDAG